MRVQQLRLILLKAHRASRGEDNGRFPALVKDSRLCSRGPDGLVRIVGNDSFLTILSCSV